MKKLLAILITLAVMTALLLPGAALADAGAVPEPALTDVVSDMPPVLIEIVSQVVATLLITLIGVLGTWLTLKVGKHVQLENINAAQQEVIRAAKTTVGELQQTVVDGLKAAHTDGKLTRGEIKELGSLLIDQTIQKLSKPSYDLLMSAAVDVTALITGAGENWINKLKKDENG